LILLNFPEIDMALDSGEYTRFNNVIRIGGNLSIPGSEYYETEQVAPIVYRVVTRRNT